MSEAMTVITVQIAGSVFNGMAEHVAMELMGFGDGVRAVAVATPDGRALHWAPEFVPGDRVTWADYDGDNCGTVRHMKRGYADYVLFQVEWDSSEEFGGGLHWMRATEIVKASPAAVTSQ